MGKKTAVATTIFRVLHFVWALIYVIELGTRVLNNKEYGGKLDYAPIVACVGVGITFLLLSIPIHAFGAYSSFNGQHQTPQMRGIRVALEVFNFFLWFINIWVIWYAPNLNDIPNDPESDAISDALYWGAPWSVPTFMMNLALVALVVAETRGENKAAGVSGVTNDVPLQQQHHADTKDVKVAEEEQHAAATV